MNAIDELIPRPSIVRERLAKNYHEADMLRRLLRLSEAEARHRHEQAQRATQAPQGQGGGQ